MSDKFVSQSGAGAMDGLSVATAWAAGSIGTITAGDDVYLLGTITSALVFNSSDNGSSGNRTTIRGDYPGNAGDIDLGGVGTTGLKLVDASYIDIKNMTIQGMQDGTSTSCVQIENQQYTKISNVTMLGATEDYMGIRMLNQDSDNPLSNIEVDSCTMTDMGLEGIQVTHQGESGAQRPALIYIHDCIITDCLRGIREVTNPNTRINQINIDGLRIVNNTITRVVLGIVQFAWGSSDYSGGGYSNISEITGNSLYDCGDLLNTNLNVIQTENCLGGYVRHNVVDGVTKAPGNGDGNHIILDYKEYISDANYYTQEVKVYGNILRDGPNQGTARGISLFRAKDCLVWGNIMQECDNGMGHDDALSTGNEYWNNTVIDCRNSGIVLNSSAAASVFKNNIFAAADGNSALGVDVNGASVAPTEENNIFFNFSGNDITPDASDSTANPWVEPGSILALGGRLVARTPLEGFGQDNTATLPADAVDYDGNTLYSTTPEPGAFKLSPPPIGNKFVSQSGAGAMDGAAADSAWAASSIGTVNPGDTVYLLGIISTALNFSVEINGTSGNLTTLRGDWPDNAGVIDSGGVVQQPLKLEDTDYVRVHRLTFTDHLDAVDTIFCYLRRARYCKVTYCTFNGPGGAVKGEGVRIKTDNTGTPTEDIEIAYCTFTDHSASDAIQFRTACEIEAQRPSQIYIHHNTITSCYRAIRLLPQGNSILNRIHADGVRIMHNSLISCSLGIKGWSWASADHSSGSYNYPSEISYNTLIGTGDATISLQNAIQTQNTFGGSVHHNLVDGLVLAGVGDGNLIIADGNQHHTDPNYNTKELKVYANVLLNGPTNISAAKAIELYRADNCVVWGNVIYNCINGIGHSGSISTNNEFWNNTIIDSGTSAIRLGADGAVAVYKNNICTQEAGGSAKGIKLPGTAIAPTEESNVFYNFDTASDVTLDASDSTADPALESGSIRSIGGRLTSDTPFKKFGQDNTAVLPAAASDVDGHAIYSAAPEPGAFKLVSNGLTPALIEDFIRGVVEDIPGGGH